MCHVDWLSGKHARKQNKKRTRHFHDFYIANKGSYPEIPSQQITNDINQCIYLSQPKIKTKKMAGVTQQSPNFARTNKDANTETDKQCRPRDHTIPGASSQKTDKQTDIQTDNGRDLTTRLTNNKHVDRLASRQTRTTTHTTRHMQADTQIGSWLFSHT